MAPVPSTPRRPAGRRPRGRPPGSGTGSRVRKAVADVTASEPPPKKRRYMPGGPGGGGRFVDENGLQVPVNPSAPVTTVSRVRTSGASGARASPTVYPRRERSTRIRTAVNREEPVEMQYSSAAAVAAAVVQSEGYKPREERGWEEFHPNLDIEATFMVFHAEDVDGTAKPSLPIPAPNTMNVPLEGSGTPVKEIIPDYAGAVNTPSGEGKPAQELPEVDTPSRRRSGRPPRESTSLYARRHSDFGAAQKAPIVLPIHNQTPKERLDLKQPSYRKTDRIQLFESKTFGQARYVSKSMMKAGYQESDNFIRDDRRLIKAIDANVEEEPDQTAGVKADGDANQHSGGLMGRVEYDMDEQDDMWLEKLNEQRKASDLDQIDREIFEITITKIEKEWHSLEKRIPKPNPKPPQTHRPRSSSAAAVNGEPQVGEEQDSKCAICDDGDCENTNAIVFCDGCDLAVHQECYGVPFIPEGQWLCRKCQLIGRGIPTCIFCPNTDGAFKQTNSSKWAHLLCAMWIPEVSLGNHTFMEPVMEVEKVPKTRWKLTCYICNQRMGACIQCSNKNCYQAFHVTCARRGRLYLKMKNSQGALAVLDGNAPLKAFCDKHCPQDYASEHGVAAATKEAKRFYKRTMKGRIWADSQASAQQLAATHRHAITEHPPDESQMTGAKVSAVLADKKKGQPNKPVWKLPSGAPIIPQVVYDQVESSMAKFTVIKKKEFIIDACRYWTLKREARRGAALLKRLQLQMETFSSMELTRRNFAAMGPSGKARLTRRTEFAATLLKDLEQLKELAKAIVEREAAKLEEAELEHDMVDTCYFPIYRLLVPVIDKAFVLDKNVFNEGLAQLQEKFDKRYYTTTLAFTHDLTEVIYTGINKETKPASVSDEPRFELIDTSPNKQGTYSEARDRKRLGKRIVKSIEPQLEEALRAEAEISSKPVEHLLKELKGMLEACLEMKQPTITVSHEDENITESRPDVDMTDVPEGQIIVADQADVEDTDRDANGEVDADTAADDEPKDDGRMEVDSGDHVQNGGSSIEVSMSEPDDAVKENGAISSNASIAEGPEINKHKPKDHSPLNDTGSPPSVNDFATMPQQPHQAAPLTPPQSNGSFGQTQPDVLTEGGLPWYLKPFELQGTTAVEEQWTGRDAVRALSEELTDMDDDALKDLEFDVDDDTITASPVDVTTQGRKRANPAKLRKGVRSSARKR